MKLTRSSVARVQRPRRQRRLLDLGMRLGEGSDAAVTVPLLRLACALHNEMATFAEAGVSVATGVRSPVTQTHPCAPEKSA